MEVAATVENGLRVRRSDGTEVNFIPASVAASFDVGEARELKVSPGDWLLLQANHGKEFINGERVQVRQIQNGRVTLADGRSLPAGFNTFTHGYAVTSHSSQGKTVDEVLLVASSRSFGAVNREQFYVSISRGRERVHVFTDDTDLLARRVTDSHERKAAIELQALRDGLAKLGFIRQEPLKEKSITLASAGNGDFLVVRQRRPMRQTRLSTVQRLATFVENVRQWIEQSLGVEPKETVTEKAVEQTESVNPARTVREALQQRHAHRHQQRRSGGMHV